MSINDAISSAVSALMAQSYALSNISSNIANSQTTAYRRTDTSFANLVTASGSATNTAGVTASASATTSIAGGLVASGVSTNLAINGDGYFVVDTKAGGDTFTGSDFYTRRGDFQMDKDGYFVNGAGYYLEGLAIDPATGEVTGSNPEVIQIANQVLAPKATTTIDYSVNLPASPDNADAAAGGLGLYTGTAGADVAANDATFDSQSISGGTVTVYDSSGAAHDVEFRWAKVQGAADPVGGVWNLYYMTDSAAVDSAVKWKNAGVSYTFDMSGNLTDPLQTVTALTALTIDGTVIGDVTLDAGTGGLTQYADAEGQVYANNVSQNGNGSASVSSVEMGDNGIVTAVYSNGMRVDVAQVVTATFKASSELKALGGGAYAATSGSGSATIDPTGTGIMAGMLEGSNTDITQEFSKLIITQQAYSAATRIMTTADDMMKEAVNMSR